MRTGDARTLATQLMHRHGLVGWQLVFDSARTRAGVCRWDRREIGLSRVLTELHSDESVLDTVLHEIAHALVGPLHGHDAVWKTTALRIGCSAQRCISPDERRPEAPWTGTCPVGHVVVRFRRPARVASCSRCSRTFDPGALLTWRRRGRSVPMGPAYDRQLARLRRSVPVPLLRDGAAAQLTLFGSSPETVVPAQPPDQPSDQPPERMSVGTLVTVGGAGRYAGTVGSVHKVGRTRYHLRTRLGALTVPFALVDPLGS